MEWIGYIWFSLVECCLVICLSFHETPHKFLKFLPLFRVLQYTYNQHIWSVYTLLYSEHIHVKTYTNGNFLIDMFTSANLLCFVIYMHMAYDCVEHSFHTLWLDYEDNDFLRIICGLSPAISKLFINTKNHRFARCQIMLALCVDNINLISLDGEFSFECLIIQA